MISFDYWYELISPIGRLFDKSEEARTSSSVHESFHGNPMTFTGVRIESSQENVLRLRRNVDPRAAPLARHEVAQRWSHFGSNSVVGTKLRFTAANSKETNRWYH